MFDLIITFFNSILHPNNAVQKMIEKDKIKQGLLLGLIGVFSFEVLSTIAQIAMGNFSTQNIMQGARRYNFFIKGNYLFYYPCNCILFY